MSMMLIDIIVAAIFTGRTIVGVTSLGLELED